MKVSEITIDYVVEHLNLEEGDYKPQYVQMILDASIAYVSEFTGIPAKELDNYPTFPTAVLCLCQDLYDNRAMYVDKSNVNKTITSILHMHRRNFL